MEVYFYVPANEAEDAVECGLKLSKWYDKEVVINGESRRCMSALLNPKDDIERYKSSEFRCLKLELPSNYCFVADRYLYKAGLESGEVMELYLSSIIPMNDYIFGKYRLPECLVTSTAIPGQVALLDKRRDTPVLFGNSEELYINKIIQAYTEVDENFNNCLLYNFFSRLRELGSIEAVESQKEGIVVFMDKSKGTAITLQIPDMGRYR